jgi:uncharacterized protein (DUF58 family)
MITTIRSIYLTRRFFIFLGVVVAVFVLGYIVPQLYGVAKGLCGLFVLFILYEVISLYRLKDGINAERKMPEKLSNGDLNDIAITIASDYPFAVRLHIIDEVPEQFQLRSSNWRLNMEANSDHGFTYQLRPVKRGKYHFGAVNVYASCFLHLIQRRYKFSQDVTVPVYPSYIQMKKYEFAAFTHKLKDYGIKKVRRLGHTMEFEQIKEYVRGDDPRTINWKASARSNSLMVNSYQDEKSQPVYCIIDKGRLMRFPFSGLSLLDYAINASLVLSNIALKKQDKAGILTFSDKLSSIVVAQRKPSQMHKIMEVLYHQKTLYKESNFELLSAYINSKISQRSLILCFTNFESYSSFERQLPYFVSLARRHLLVVIFFKNRELMELIENHPENNLGIYTQVIAQQYESDKYLITRKLQNYGIHSILTYPEDLTVDTINKYLELKAKGTI